VNEGAARALSASLILAAAMVVLTGTTVGADVVITSTATPTVPAVRLVPPPRSFSLLATGDVLTESPVALAAAAFAAGTPLRFDFTPLFGPIAAMLSSADIAICHMEMPIGAPDDRSGVYGRSPFGGNLILAPNEIAGDLRRVGFDRCSTASNHSNDLGEPGIDTTLAALDAAGITHAGTARNASEATTKLLTVNGVKLAHLAYTRYSNTVLPVDPWRVNFAASPEQIAADVRAARAAGAEVVVVSVHISRELLDQPTPEDRQFITDLTALVHLDLIIEHGPHVIQPVEKVNGTWVYWSVGNFISGMGSASRGKYADPRTLDGIAAGARFTETSPGSFTVEPWPVLLCNEVFTRVVYAPIGVGLAPSPAIDSEMAQCIQRSLPVVPTLH
jgi:poly-gamma-glutamate synthesis protein (capsule biosynthesis protein)